MTAPTRGRLVFDGVHKRFTEGGTPAIRDVSLTCAPGELVVVVGPSGCGKSTLLALAAGTLRPDEGTVSLDGHAIDGPGPDRAIVFQEHSLFPWLDAASNVELGLEIAGVPRSERRDRVQAVLEAVHLPDVGKKLVHELSGGMRQRVAIARALVLRPSVLLMDEPFSALDPRTRAHLHDQVEQLWADLRTTVLFVTHSPSEAVRLADRVVILARSPGEVRKEIPIELDHPRTPGGHHERELARLVRAEIEAAARGDGREPEDPDDGRDSARDLASVDSVRDLVSGPRIVGDPVPYD